MRLPWGAINTLKTLLGYLLCLPYKVIFLLLFCLQQAKAEQEEEFISNTLMKKIHTLKKEKEVLAMNYEQEEEFLTNDLSKKLMQVCGVYVAYLFYSQSFLRKFIFLLIYYWFFLIKFCVQLLHLRASFSKNQAVGY